MNKLPAGTKALADMPKMSRQESKTFLTREDSRLVSRLLSTDPNTLRIDLLPSQTVLTQFLKDKGLAISETGSVSNGKGVTTSQPPESNGKSDSEESAFLDLFGRFFLTVASSKVGKMAAAGTVLAGASFVGAQIFEKVPAVHADHDGHPHLDPPVSPVTPRPGTQPQTPTPVLPHPDTPRPTAAPSATPRSTETPRATVTPSPAPPPTAERVIHVETKKRVDSKRNGIFDDADLPIGQDAVVWIDLNGDRILNNNEPAKLTRTNSDGVSVVDFRGDNMVPGVLACSLEQNVSPSLIPVIEQDCNLVGNAGIAVNKLLNANREAAPPSATPRVETPAPTLPPTERPRPTAPPPAEKTPPPATPPSKPRTPEPRTPIPVIPVVTPEPEKRIPGPTPAATPEPIVCPDGKPLPEAFQTSAWSVDATRLEEIKCQIMALEVDAKKKNEMLKALKLGQIHTLELLMGKDLDGDGIVGPDENKDGRPDVPSIPEQFDGLTKEQIHTQELITGKDLDGDGIIGPDLNKDGQADGPSVPTTVEEKVKGSENRITQLLGKIGNGVHDIWDRVSTGGAAVGGATGLALVGIAWVARRRLRQKFQGIDQSFTQVQASVNQVSTDVQARVDQLSTQVQNGLDQVQQAIQGLRQPPPLPDGDEGGERQEPEAKATVATGAGAETPEPGRFTDEQIQVLARTFEFLDRIFNTVDELSDSQIARRIRAANMTEEQMNAFRQALVQSIMILSEEEDEEELNKLSPVRLIRRLSVRRRAINQTEALRIATTRDQLRVQAQSSSINP